MPKIGLPARIGVFAEAQHTVAVARITDSVASRRFPSDDYWQRAIAAMLLSGRVKPKQNGSPNRTDANRICEKASFNPGLFQRFGGFLVDVQIVTPARARD